MQLQAAAARQMKGSRSTRKPQYAETRNLCAAEFLKFTAETTEAVIPRARVPARVERNAKRRASGRQYALRLGQSKL